MGLIGFTLGGIGLMFHPPSYTVFWIGVGVTVAAGVIFLVLDRLGLGDR